MNDKNGYKIRNIPMIGWNNLDIKKNDQIFSQIEAESFYFTHSFYCDPKDKNYFINIELS